jgi:23S rRNA (guanosine2251-2'-O)-methyltransferase
MLIFGYHPTREALRRRPGDVERVLVSRRRGDGRRRQVETLCRRHGIPVVETSVEELDRIGGEVHNGFAAEVGELDGALEPAAGDPSLVMLLEDIQDPRNLGALLRVCEAAGVGRILIRDRGSSAVTPAVVKTSAGAAEWMVVERVVNSGRELKRLQEEGFWVYGAAAGGQVPWKVDLTGPLVLCLGGEEKGLRRRTRELCDGLLGLPMLGRVESLNVATAASALLYEALRQRLEGKER